MFLLVENEEGEKGEERKEEEILWGEEEKEFGVEGEEEILWVVVEGEGDTIDDESIVGSFL